MRNDASALLLRLAAVSFSASLSQGVVYLVSHRKFPHKIQAKRCIVVVLVLQKMYETCTLYTGAIVRTLRWVVEIATQEMNSKQCPVNPRR